jgi:signal transduction histidine kinase
MQNSFGMFIPETRGFLVLLAFLYSLNRVTAEVPEVEPWTSLTLANAAVLARNAAQAEDRLWALGSPVNDAEALFAWDLIHARWYAFQGRLSESGTHASAALTRVVSLPASVQPLARAATHHRLGVLRRLLADDDEAMRLQMSAERGYTDAQWDLDAAFCRVEMAAILMKRGDPGAAIDLYLSTLDVVAREGSPLQRATIRYNMAVAMQRAGNDADAEPLMRDLLSLPPYDQPIPERAVIAQNLALMAKLAGRVDEARTWYGDAQRCLDPQVHASLLGRLHVSMADLALRTNDVDEARAQMQIAEGYVASEPSTVSEIERAATWARIHAHDGNHARAAQAFERARTLAREQHLLEEHTSVLTDALLVFDDAAQRLPLLEELVAVQSERLAAAQASVARIVAVRTAYEHDLAAREIERQHELMRTIIDTHDATLRDVGRDLHDSLGQDLTVLQKLLQRLRQYADEVPDELIAHLDLAIGVSERAAHDARRISHLLAANDVVGGHLERAINDVMEGMRAAWPEVQMSTTFHGDLSAISDAMARMLFRCAQGLLQNAMRHAAPHSITLQVIVRDAAVHLSVEDDGVGFDLAQAHAGMGLRELHARAEALGGTVHVDSSRGHGTFVLVTVPLEQ